MSSTRKTKAPLSEELKRALINSRKLQRTIVRAGSHHYRGRSKYEIRKNFFGIVKLL